MRMIILLLLIAAVTNVIAQRQTENLVIVTLDGFRWQDIFQGADSSLLFSDVSDTSIISRFWARQSEVRRSKLLPFFWNIIGAQGQLYGNRVLNNRVNCSNPHWFSYPGYSEMFTGFVDLRIRSNSKKSNPNSTVFEFINNHSSFNGEVAAFSTWDVIPFIIRADEANIPVNDFKNPGEYNALSGELMASRQQHVADTSSKGKDVTTFLSAMQYLKTERPKVLYISLDDTDAYGHRGNYEEYLRAAHETDQMLSILWEWLQGDEQYRKKTTLLITTDHGRGSNSWTKHGRFAAGSGHIWFAVIGPDTPARGEMRSTSTYYQKQFAKTAASFLGLDFTNRRPVGDEVHSMYFVKEITSR